jgi:hypothetical protein
MQSDVFLTACGPFSCFSQQLVLDSVIKIRGWCQKGKTGFRLNIHEMALEISF